VHLILVPGATWRRSCTVHPTIKPDGSFSRVDHVSPRQGRNRIVVDGVPAARGSDELPALLDDRRRRCVQNRSRLPPLGADPRRSDGYRFRTEERPHILPRRIQPAFSFRLHGHTAGRDAPHRFTPWFGRLRHAIFFRRGARSTTSTRTSCAPGRVRVPPRRRSAARRSQARRRLPGKLNRRRTRAGRRKRGGCSCKTQIDGTSRHPRRSPSS